ncbi:ribulose-1,5 bisphosphate carboxylase/oxygenase large subunit N-methyltransferase, chloroplastic isoform X1 [Dendrobium catenatum]|uniref:Ribulose-1,5 bisphosphate carboxylase/oxygenase large subunit N-methyltransferase, chloroplastic n=1 Tax=Dendrobium catenatum TaxID=906689 RepID=A0A2I0W4Q4_9ASPA|nr:ribulose-1,5 bisphosphate carboxylase/oxygenase large subunit N-methyltransferase, chloroplastic isoform X1 [Dendrobium catenatum]PKU70628.1 Ribulose-1,5 bisphosphate carboxylase/oxygenase large subunit N-methyltransferase, chloroplastic [Dendrobium catenatum]
MRTLIRMASIFSRIQPHRIPQFSRRFLNVAAASLKDTSQLFNQCNELMIWLRRKTGLEISSVLAIGTSSYGRSLFASKPIEDGDCILKIPYTVHLTPDKILPEVESLIVDDVGTISRLAVVLLAEQKLGKNSDWFPYLNNLPHAVNMHNTIFWAPEELNMIQQSSIYHETVNLKSSLAREFSALKPVLQHFPSIFGDIRLDDFMHAYTLVISRAWGTSNCISLVPFADFLNHDGASEAVLLNDDGKEISEVIADRNYSVGEEVLIRYGKFSNSTLMLDYGFTLPHNINDQVQIFMDVPLYDPLYKMKMELLHKHLKLPIAEENCFSSSGCSFIMKEVKSSDRKGKGIPPALRAFARILTVSTCEELTSLATEASQSDGRLARRPLKNTSNEIQAHCILLSKFEDMIKCRDAVIKVLESSNVPYCGTQLSVRRQMAIDLLKGEIRVLQSASSWIANYCKRISACFQNHSINEPSLFS